MNNIEIVKKLAEALKKALPQSELQNLVVFGSAAIVLNKVDLHRRVHDLDIFVSADSFDRIRAYSKELRSSRGYISLEIAPNVEVLNSFPGVSFEKVLEKSFISDRISLPVACLEDLAEWKRIQATLRKTSEEKEKDLNDLRRIEAALGSRTLHTREVKIHRHQQ